MKKELEAKLFEKYNTLFERRSLDMTKTTMCWGVDVGDGWYSLLDEVCAKLVALHPNIRADQVKEKYGTLRFYIGSEGEVPHDIMDKAYDLEIEYENRSATICEDCGQPGLLRGSGWVRTLCDAHAAIQGYRSEDLP